MARRNLRLGVGVAALAAALLLVFLTAERAGLFDLDRLVLVTVDNARELREGDPVIYRGLEVGRVETILPPGPGQPGWRLRLAVERRAFLHIAADAKVRLDPPARPGKPMRATILPGRQRPDPDYPARVKVLVEVSREEEALRMVQDVLSGLSDLSRSKRSETEVLDLRDEVERLRRENRELRERLAR